MTTPVLTEDGKRLAEALRQAGMITDRHMASGYWIAPLNAAAASLRLPLEGDASLREACDPWSAHTGEPPADDSPLMGVFGAGMNYTEDLLASLLQVSSFYERGDGSEDFDSDATKTLVNILVAAELWDEDKNCPVSALARPQPEAKGPVAAGEESASILINALNECADIFTEIRNDYTDPRSECRQGRSLISEALSDYAAALASTTPPAEAKTPDAAAGGSVGDESKERREYRDWMRRTAMAMPELAARVFALRGKPYMGSGFHWSMERSLGRAIASVNDYEGKVWHGKEAFANRLTAQICVESLFESVAKAEQSLTPTGSAGEDDTGVREALAADVLHYIQSSENGLSRVPRQLLCRIEDVLRSGRAPQPPKAETPAGVGELIGALKRIVGMNQAQMNAIHRAAEMERIARAALSTAPAAWPGDEVERWRPVSEADYEKLVVLGWWQFSTLGFRPRWNAEVGRVCDVGSATHFCPLPATPAIAAAPAADGGRA